MMNITGVDYLVFGAEDLAATEQFARDFGLEEGQGTGIGKAFVALDGTGIIVADKNDPALPPALESGNQLRKIIWGVRSESDLYAVADEIGKDREVRKLDNGSIEAIDDMGLVIGFQLTVRQELDLPGEAVNVPGSFNRKPNQLGVDVNARPKPRSLGHFACFVPDSEKQEELYVKRLGFRVSDRMTGGGAFLRAPGTMEHHSVFFIKTPPHIKGIEHMAFHFGGPQEVFMGGKLFQEKGYESFWGPGRHIPGSNWFWYFSSPLGCRFEFDADIDLLDENWVPREMPVAAESTQVFLLKNEQELWAPFGKPKH